MSDLLTRISETVKSDARPDFNRVVDRYNQLDRNYAQPVELFASGDDEQEAALRSLLETYFLCGLSAGIDLERSLTAKR